MVVGGWLAVGSRGVVRRQVSSLWGQVTEWPSEVELGIDRDTMVSPKPGQNPRLVIFFLKRIDVVEDRNATGRSAEANRDAKKGLIGKQWRLTLGKPCPSLLRTPNNV